MSDNAYTIPLPKGLEQFSVVENTCPFLRIQLDGDKSTQLIAHDTAIDMEDCFIKGFIHTKAAGAMDTMIIVKAMHTSDSSMKGLRQAATADYKNHSPLAGYSITNDTGARVTIEPLINYQHSDSHLEISLEAPTAPSPSQHNPVAGSVGQKFILEVGQTLVMTFTPKERLHPLDVFGVKPAVEVCRENECLTIILNSITYAKPKYP